MNQKPFTQVIINDITEKKLSRVLMGKLAAVTSNAKLNSVAGPLEIMVGGWLVPRPNPNVRRVFVIFADDVNVATFNSALDQVSSQFLHGDKLVLAQNDLLCTDVMKANCTKFNFVWWPITRIVANLGDIDLKDFIKVIGDAILYDDKPITAREEFKK